MFFLKSRLALVFFILACVGFGALIFFQTFFMNREPYVDLSKRIPATGITQLPPSDGRSLRFAVATMWSVESTFSMYLRLSKRIAREMGLKDSMILRPSYTTLRQAMENDKIDVAFVCTGPYVYTLPGKHIRLLVEPEFVNDERYHSVIIASSKSNLRSIDDLRGVTMGFSDPESFTGYLLPYIMLKERNIDPDTYFKKIVFTGSHDRSIFAVDRGMVNAVAVHSIVLESAKRADPSLQGRLRILWESETYGPPPIIVSTALPKTFADSLKQSFLNLDKDRDGREILAAIGMKRFVPAREEDYASAVRLFERYEKMRKEK